MSKSFTAIANKYARDVVAGKIKACRYVTLVCEQHLSDLSKEKSNRNFKYKYDKKAAERVCNFIQRLPHTKGEWAARRELLKLEAWQVLIACMIFGWKKKQDGFRRYQTVYVEVPRKNGKTAFISAVGLYMFCADGEYGAEVYAGAVTEKQALEVFRPARLICKKTPELVEWFGVEVNAQNLNIAADNSRFEPVIGDPGDGSSPSCAIHDEVHEHKTSNQIDTMRTGMGSRRQPLQLFITTSGFDISSPCYDIRQEVIDNVEGITKNENLLGFIYTIDIDDDWTDIKSIIKANPNIGVSVHREYLESELARAKSVKRLQSTFKTKHCNVWVFAKEAFINMEKWKACEDLNLSMQDFHGQEAVVSLDMASKLDLTAKVQVFAKDIEGKRHYYCVAPSFYIPEDTIHNNVENQKTSDRYKKWENKGLLIPTDGAEIDFRYIKHDILDLQSIIRIKNIPIDPHGATGLAHELMDEGLEVINIPQNMSQMTPPMKELEAAVEGGRLHHDGNPIMTWCVANMIAKYTSDGKMMKAAKQKNENKIDGAVALLMAIGRLMPDYEDLAEKTRQGMVDLDNVAF